MSGCVAWTGSMDAEGYGRINGQRAHRVAYEAAKGPIPPGLTIDHLCRNRGCVNPDHLEAVTARVNTLRGIGPTAVHAQQVTCIRGHDLDGTNLRILQRQSGPERVCRACERIRQAKVRLSRRTAA